VSLLFFDTETTGLVKPNLPLDHPSQPHIVQVAAILSDDVGRELACFCTLISPTNWVIEAEAEAVHGISMSDCKRWGLPIEAGMAMLSQFVYRSSRFIAHNMDFDSKVVGSEYLRLGKSNCPFIVPPDGKDSYCTMKASTDVCKLPGRFRSGYKWPKLVEAHRHFFQEDFDGAHDALVDVRACKRVYFALNQTQHTSAGMLSDSGPLV